MQHPNLIPYVGSKYRLAKKLIPFFPKHKTYVEVFGGAANILLQKPKSKVEVYNDINQDLYNLFNILRTRKDEFIELIKYTPHSRTLYLETKKLEPKDELEQAWKFYVLQKFGYAGKGSSFGFGKDYDTKAVTTKAIQNLPIIAERLIQVTLENKSWDALLPIYDAPDTFLYMDPPYIPETRSGGKYAHEMTHQDHIRMLELVKSGKGKYMLSGYDNSTYNDYLEGWNKESFKVYVSSTNKSKIKDENDKLKDEFKREEVIWYNYGINRKLF